MFEEIEITQWRQFEKVKINFHPRLTILTGQNGSGKTTILNILSRHFGWDIRYVGTPKADKSGRLSFISDIWKWLSGADEQAKSSHNQIGRIRYSNGVDSPINVPSQVAQEYDVQISNQQNQPGLHIPSHRPVYIYRPLQNIPTSVIDTQLAASTFINDFRSRYLGTGGVPSPNYRIKETLISLAVFGPGNEIVTPNAAALITFNEFQSILRTMLPKALGFRRLIIRMPEVVLDTSSGEFSLDAVSGGIASIIDISWQVYMYSRWVKEKQDQQGIVVAIDEPENHLHPQMQRTLLADLVVAFPNVQFIIATHSPFIVTSSPDSNVYVLTFGSNNRVTSILLENVNKAGSSTDVLREVLGVPVTIPPWAEERLENLLQKYTQTDLSEAGLAQLKQDMTELGLDRLYPESLARLMKKKTDD